MSGLRGLIPYNRKLCRVKKCLTSKALACVIVIFVVGVKITIHHSTTQYLRLSTIAVHHNTLVDAIASRASHDRYIVLSLVDEAFADMAVNLYQASFRPHHINNYLFVGIGKFTCNFLARMSLECFYYIDDLSANRASAYGSVDFIRKVRIKCDIITEALSANFTVVLTDLDVYFISNPLDEIRVSHRFHRIVIHYDLLYNCVRVIRYDRLATSLIARKTR